MILFIEYAFYSLTSQKNLKFVEVYLIII